MPKKEYVIETVRGEFDPAVFIEGIKDKQIEEEWIDRYHQLKPWFERILFTDTIPMSLLDSVDNEFMEWLEDAVRFGKDFIGACEHTTENFFYQYLRSIETIQICKKGREKPQVETFF